MSTSTLTKNWQSLDRPTVCLLQGRQLHHFIRDSVLPFSAHYRRVFAEHGISADDVRTVDDLRRIPFSSKQDLLPTPENPRRSLDFALIPDAKALSKRVLTDGPQRPSPDRCRAWPICRPQVRD